MDSLLHKMLDHKVFSVFVNENMKNSTYKAFWKDEMEVEYEASKSFKASLADYAAAVAGSVVDKNSDKPRHSMPTAAELTGSLARMADEWQMDNDRLDHYLYLENRYRNQFGSLGIVAGDSRSEEQFRKMIAYLFNPYEKAAIAPHKRIDLMYFEGLFKGTITITKNNNSKSGITDSVDLGVKSFGTSYGLWSNPEAKPLNDIEDICEKAEAMGKSVMRIRMSRATFRQMMATTQMAGKFRLDIAAGVVTSPIVSPDVVNQYFESISLPTIVVEAPKPILLANGTSVNAIPNNRVVFQMADKVAVLKVADSTEMVDPLPNKVYATVDDNLVGQWRDSKGRFIDYEMWAYPAFVGKNDFFILKTDVAEG